MIEGISFSTAFGGHVAGLLLEAEKAAAGPVPVLARCYWSMAGWLDWWLPSRDNATAKAPCNSFPLSPSEEGNKLAAHLDLTMEGDWDNHMRFQLRWKEARQWHSSMMDLRDKSLLFGLARPPASPKSMEMTTGQPRACAASPDSCRHKETRIHLPSDINMYTLSCHEQRHTSLHFSSKLCLQYYSTQHCHETSSCICCSGRTLVNFQLNSFNPGSLGILG